MHPGEPSSEDPKAAYANWRVGDPDPATKPKVDAIDAPILASGNEPLTNQIAPAELLVEMPVTGEALGVNRINELFDVREKMNRATEEVNKLSQMSDEEIEDHIENEDLMTRDGELLTVEEFRQRVQERLGRFKGQEQAILEKYQGLASLARNTAHTYAERISAEDRVTLTERGREAATLWLSRESNLNTYSELYYLILVQPGFWQGSANEVAEKFDATANGIVDRPQDFNVADSQFGKMIAGLPDNVQRALLGILVNEGDVSVGSESRLLAERIRQNPTKNPTELFSERDREIRTRANKSHTDEQQWMRTEAIQYLLRELYPELSQ